MSKKGSTLLAFFAGAAAGTLAGLLLAPDKGTNTRKKLAYQVDNLGGEVASQVKTGSKQVRKFADRAMHEMGNSVKKIGAN